MQYTEREENVLFDLKPALRRNFQMVTNMASSDNCMCRSSHPIPTNSENNGSKYTKKATKMYGHAKSRYRPYSHNKRPTEFMLRLIVGIWCLFSCVTPIPGAAVYTNVDFRSNPSFEPICKQQREHFIESDGKESSLILEFNKADLSFNERSCTRILSAPPNYSFIIRLILPKLWHASHYNSNSHGHRATPTQELVQGRHERAAANNDAGTSNATASLKIGRRCPLSIFSSHDPHTPQWRVDPCQLEDTAPEMEDPVRLLHGRVRIVWEHRNQTLNSKLMVTVLGKGVQCRSENKHQCLKIGDEPILCISKDLICDGIRHCPYSNEHDSDEDYAMCWKRSRLGEPVPPAMDSDIFEHLALEVFRNLFAFDVPSVAKATATMPLKGVNSVVDQNISADADGDDDEKPDGVLVAVDENKNSTHKISTPDTVNDTAGGHHHRRNGTRTGLNSDLSKYGPWGYLMLGMLLCGGALLICGLWVCCCRFNYHIETIRSLSASASQHAANNERESALQNANAANIAAGLVNDSLSTPAAPPNYEELDPPPAYSVLFPHQKAASSNTLNSLDVHASVSAHQQLSPSAAPSSRSTTRTDTEVTASSNANIAHND
ncbi:uncharacterized protein LOC101890315 isoform X2 [Musca domestica]|uniref:Uncharacterized protein LOC101890315 isoform X2 n=1 Tax=Musca domestica TaxID=7370 RepID=A0ABM3VLS2_MUSDO|nr:uncharacterized protein LOC101890315 isoform X2 [Musca domestica]